jgi:NAD(P)-dependent dehydrogenase (short-subunit alcohol dehydrogenase family)
MSAYAFNERAKQLNESHPMGKHYKPCDISTLLTRDAGRVGSPRDMAGLFLFLVSPGGAHVTGAHIEIDGGFRISGHRL